MKVGALARDDDLHACAPCATATRAATRLWVDAVNQLHARPLLRPATRCAARRRRHPGAGRRSTTCETMASLDAGLCPSSRTKGDTASERFAHCWSEP
jgi:hypothetical protein